MLSLSHGVREKSLELYLMEPTYRFNDRRESSELFDRAGLLKLLYLRGSELLV